MLTTILLQSCFAFFLSIHEIKGQLITPSSDLSLNESALDPLVVTLSSYLDQSLLEPLPAIESTLLKEADASLLIIPEDPLLDPKLEKPLEEPREATTEGIF